jgi:hypothetical protein
MSLGAQSVGDPQHIVWEQACKSSGLQTLSVGNKSQIIGAKEQGPKRACVVTDDYDRHGYADEDKRIMAAVARHVTSIVEGKATSNVVALR